MRPPSGHGEGQFKIAQHDRGGWVRVYLQGGEPPDGLNTSRQMEKCRADL